MGSFLGNLHIPRRVLRSGAGETRTLYASLAKFSQEQGNNF